MQKRMRLTGAGEDRGGGRLEDEVVEEPRADQDGGCIFHVVTACERREAVREFVAENQGDDRAQRCVDDILGVCCSGVVLPAHSRLEEREAVLHQKNGDSVE